MGSRKSGGKVCLIDATSAIRDLPEWFSAWEIPFGRATCWRQRRLRRFPFRPESSYQTSSARKAARFAARPDQAARIAGMPRGFAADSDAIRFYRDSSPAGSCGNRRGVISTLVDGVVDRVVLVVDPT